MAIKEKKRVRSSYNELGGDLYNTRYRDEQEVKYDVIFSLIEVKLNNLLLDDGCGSGMLLERLIGPTVGLDFSSELLSTAKRKLKLLHYLVQGDAEKLPFRKGIFDAVVSVTLLQNTPEPEQVLSEIGYVTHFGGALAITALKKTFTNEEFLKIMKSAAFKYFDIVPSESSPDWYAYGER